MSVNIDPWLARIGLFIQKIKVAKTVGTTSYWYLIIVNYKVIVFLCMLLLTH